MKKISPFLAVFSVYFFKVIFMYAQNCKEIGFSQTFIPMIILQLIGFSLFFISKMLIKNNYAASLFSCICGIFILNYSLVAKIITRIMPIFRVWHIVPIFAFVIGVLIFSIQKRFPNVSQNICNIICITFSALILVNTFTAVGTLLFTKHDFKISTEISSLQLQPSNNRQNIYYLVTDEYASFFQSETYMGYDNQQLKQVLEKNNFNISTSSHNESVYTDTILTNILMLDYVVTDENTAAEKFDLRKKSLLFDVLAKAGYSINGVGETSWLGINNNFASQKDSAVTTIDGKSFSSLVFAGTAFENSLKLQSHETESSQLILQSFDALDKINIQPNSSNFTFFYVCSPHEPFYFNKDGEMNPASKIFFDGSDDDSAYIGQMQYVTSRLETAIERITKADPDSIIVLSSDHGYRYKKNTPTQDCKIIINGLYYANKDMPDFEGLSGVNTARYILNNVLDLSLEYKELPND